MSGLQPWEHGGPQDPSCGHFLPDNGVGIPPTEPCTPEDCGHSCWWEPGATRYSPTGRVLPGEGAFTRDITVHHTDSGDVDGEGPCWCEHHEAQEVSA